MSKTRTSYASSECLAHVSLKESIHMFLRISRGLNTTLRNRPILLLEEFLFRQKVLQTYRNVMRVIYKHHEKKDLAQYAREEFRLNKDAELNHRKYLLQIGLNRINDMAKVFGISAKF